MYIGLKNISRKVNESGSVVHIYEIADSNLSINKVKFTALFSSRLGEDLASIDHLNQISYSIYDIYKFSKECVLSFR